MSSVSSASSRDKADGKVPLPLRTDVSLPPEIIFRILSFSDISTLRTFSLCSRSSFHLAAPYLYSDLYSSPDDYCALLIRAYSPLIPPSSASWFAPSSLLFLIWSWFITFIYFSGFSQRIDAAKEHMAYIRRITFDQLVADYYTQAIQLDEAVLPRLREVTVQLSYGKRNANAFNSLSRMLRGSKVERLIVTAKADQMAKIDLVLPALPGVLTDGQGPILSLKPQESSIRQYTLVLLDSYCYSHLNHPTPPIDIDFSHVPRDLEMTIVLIPIPEQADVPFIIHERPCSTEKTRLEIIAAQIARLAVHAVPEDKRGLRLKVVGGELVKDGLQWHGYHAGGIVFKKEVERQITELSKSEQGAGADTVRDICEPPDRVTAVLQPLRPESQEHDPADLIESIRFTGLTEYYEECNRTLPFLLDNEIRLALLQYLQSTGIDPRRVNSQMMRVPIA